VTGWASGRPGRSSVEAGLSLTTESTGGVNEMDDPHGEPLRRLAFHEAGHAVVAVLCHLGLGQVTIVEDDDCSGHASVTDPLRSWKRGDGPRQVVAESYVMSSYAGYAAEAVFFPGALPSGLSARGGQHRS
jgi:hypothetical protein